MPIIENDKVRLSGEFIQRLGTAFDSETYDHLHKHGTVQSVKKLSGNVYYCKVLFENETKPRGVVSTDLEKYYESLGLKGTNMKENGVYA